MRKIHRNQKELKSRQERRPIQPSVRMGRVTMRRARTQEEEEKRQLEAKEAGNWGREEGGVGKDWREGNESWQRVKKKIKS